MNRTWLVDFEFQVAPGAPPRPICMVARCVETEQVIRLWLWDSPPAECPFPLGSDTFYLSYSASAEMGCHLALGWSMPVHLIDLYAEFSVLVCGRVTPAGRSLLGALQWFGLGGISCAEKDEMRALAIRGGPFSDDEREALLDYCQTDVDALFKLFKQMRPTVDVPRALIRGRYTIAVARVEGFGVPVDADLFFKLKDHWPRIKRELILNVDRDYGVYRDGTFKEEHWVTWCESMGIVWPRLESGRPDLKAKTFREMARLRPEVRPIYELRTTLSRLKLNDLAVGPDGRNRYLLKAFGAKTGRNTPSSSRAIFGPASWIRHLIRPEEGMAIAYVDWCQQELGIAACLSEDHAMKQMYCDGDPYIAFAKLAGAVPPNATKASHSKERGMYKICALAVLMGMGAKALGLSTGTNECMGHYLLAKHRLLFPRFWEWSEDQVNRALLGIPLKTSFGWTLHPNKDRPTTFRNFGLQANGAEMLRFAAMAATERGIKVCALVHDAMLIEAPIEQIDSAVAETRRCMAAASRAVLRGFELGTEAEIIHWPNRFVDGRGAMMWNVVNELLQRQEQMLQIGASPVSI